MSDVKDQTITLNVRLKPSESSAHPRATNYTGTGSAVSGGACPGSHPFVPVPIRSLRGACPGRQTSAGEKVECPRFSNNA